MKRVGADAWVLNSLEDRRMMSIGPVTIPDGSINDSVYDANAKTLHVVYLDNAGNDLKYRSFNDNGTSTAAVTVAEDIIVTTSKPQLGSPGLYVALGEDSTGVLHLAYYDATKGDLVYARRDLAGTWTNTTLDAKNSVGLYPSLAIDSDDHPTVSYYNKTAGDLKLAEFNGTKWLFSTIASGGDQGRYSSLHINPSTGRYSVAFSDDTNGVLKYAERTASTWSIKTIDSVITKGASYVSLDYNEDRPEIAYCDTANSDLKFAERSSRGKWNTRTLATAGDQGFYADLEYTFDTAQPAIVYYNRTSDNVMLTYRNPNGTWAVETEVTGGGQNLSATDAPSLQGEVPLLFLCYSDKDLLQLFIGSF